MGIKTAITDYNNLASNGTYQRKMIEYCKDRRKLRALAYREAYV